jgi:hypothetical protein
MSKRSGVASLFLPLYATESQLGFQLVLREHFYEGIVAAETCNPMG